MLIAIRPYLETIRHEEQFKPDVERKPVPSVSELADEAGFTRAHLYKLMKNETTVVNLKHLDGILRALRRRGFDTGVADLLEFRAS